MDANRPRPRLLVCPGSRAAEAVLLAQLDRLLAAAETEPALLARPVRVVVPSRSLRLHVAGALMRHRRRAAAGLVVQTHFALALEVLERAGETVPSGRLLWELLPQRLARREDTLSRPLEDLLDGYAAVVATVRDLLDAGFEPGLLEGLDDALEEEVRGGGGVAVSRARALLRVAAGTFEALEREAVGHTSRLLRRSTELLELHGETVLPARAVLIHGFADATGTVTDLLQALQRRLAAQVLLDRPPDPAAGTAKVSDTSPPTSPPTWGGRFGERFGERFVERLTLAAAPEPAGTAPPPAHLERFTARGAAGEVREVARRLAAELASGVRPEGLAVVARDLAPYRLELRRQLTLLGIAFSGLGEPGALTPEGRRSRALLDLLRRGARVPAERWLDAVETLPGEAGEPPRPATLELRLALAALGAARLDSVAEVAVERVLRDGRYPLPLRQGLGEDPAEEDGLDEAEPDDAGRAPRRSLEGPRLERAVRSARDLCGHLALWPETATLEEHRRHLETLLRRHLGWRGGGRDGTASGNGAETASGTDPVLGALEDIAAEAPPRLRLTFDELRSLLGRALDDRGFDALGGRGGGVQVLSVTEARGRTFDHLFLIGLERDVFPRPIREDPLLADDLRSALLPLLPDLPIKATGFDEERHLFAQLLSASPRLTLSWQSFDDQGSPRSPSPLVERLLRHTAAAPPEATPPWALDPSKGADGALPRPAAEAATLAALHGGRARFRPLLPLAVAEARRSLPRARPRPADELAAARLAVLDELDPDLATPEGRAAAARLGPFFGFVGAVARDGDPRCAPIWITTLERLAGCPWQVFLTRLLRLEPTPDPLQALPSLDPLLVGALVHRTLERLVGSGLGETQGSAGELAAVLERSPRIVPWPAAERLRQLLDEQARQLLAEEGIPLPGLGQALARFVLPYLEAARQQDWQQNGPAAEDSGNGGPAVLGVEIDGSLGLTDADGRPRRLHFRADRVDRIGTPPGGAEAPGNTGGVLLTDYKTGRPVGRGGREAVKAETRRRYLLDEVAAGTRLQAAAYARTAGERGSGRYLFLRPETEHREHAVDSADEDFAEAFERAVRAALAAWDAGTFFPRVVDPEGREEPPRCSFCPVAEACLRGDSSARRRLASWADAARGATVDDDRETRLRDEALLGVWELAGGRG